jgi:hypothetical protein
MRERVPQTAVVIPNRGSTLQPSIKLVCLGLMNKKSEEDLLYVSIGAITLL